MQYGADALEAEQEAQRSAGEGDLPYISPYDDLQVGGMLIVFRPSNRGFYSFVQRSLFRARASAPGHGHPMRAHLTALAIIRLILLLRGPFGVAPTVDGALCPELGAT